MLPRLDEIEEDLLARRAHAEHEAWLGEVEGIDLTLTIPPNAASDKSRSTSFQSAFSAYNARRRSSTWNSVRATNTDASPIAVLDETRARTATGMRR